VGSLFNLVTISVVLFSFIKSHLSVLSLSCWAIGALFRKLLHTLISSMYFLLFHALGSVFQVLC
jgi:hypothetical protein